MPKRWTAFAEENSEVATCKLDTEAGLSGAKRGFRAKLDRLHPSYKKPTQLSLDFADDEPDPGKGL
jgi:hypothetical protein